MNGHHMKQLLCFWSSSAPKEDEKETEREKTGEGEGEGEEERKRTYFSPPNCRKMANLHLCTAMEAVAQTATASRGNVVNLNL